MSVVPNYNVANNLHTALQQGMSESTVESQYTKAINVLTAYTAVDNAEAAAVTTALAILNTQRNHIRAPGTKGGA